MKTNFTFTHLSSTTLRYDLAVAGTEPGHWIGLRRNLLRLVSLLGIVVTIPDRAICAAKDTKSGLGKY